jgi:hypothetical protein
LMLDEVLVRFIALPMEFDGILGPPICSRVRLIISVEGRGTAQRGL